MSSSLSPPSPPLLQLRNDNQHKNAGLEKRNIAIALGIGLGLVALITMCLLYSPFHTDTPYQEYILTN